MRTRAFVRSFRPVLALLVAVWAVELVNWALGHRLVPWLGLEPRSLPGLIGVPLMPFLHTSLDHAAANTVPLAILGGLGMLVAPRRFPTATVAIVLISGLAVWVLARPHSIHVGASGLIFGWFGYLLALGFLERSFRAIAGSVIVIAVYGGLVWGMLPRFGAAISWEAHVFGALTGIGVAWLLGGRRR
ncbi:MAG TPA: rhomboid family intramembrane serine protease [Paracoccaceae bacterium]|nr:rhomboid family intramembrane serine protease [Paracoccaceae bacterium]